MMKKIIKKPVFLAILIAAGLFFLNYQGLLERPKNIFFQITDPFQGFVYKSGQKLNNFVALFQSIKRLNEENNRYQAENRKLKAEITDLREAARENEFLRQQLNLEPSGQRELILAEVVGRSSVNLGDSFLINKGQKHGLKKGAVVVAPPGFLVGRISGLSLSSAWIRLITNPASRVNAVIQESRTEGVIKGEAGSDLIMDWVQQETKIEPGEIVITSGLEGIFPKGLLIGQIGKIISNQTEVFQKAIINPAVDFKRLEKVFVIVQQNDL